MNDSSNLREAPPHPDLRSLLDAVEAASPVEAVDVLARELSEMVDAQNVSFLIADFTGDALIRFVSAPQSQRTQPEQEDSVERVPLAGSMHEKALLTQRVQIERKGGVSHLYAPVTDRGDALGILELTLARKPDKEMTAFLASAAHALSYVIIANRRHTDLFERGQRNLPFSIAAEIQRRLLPAAFTCEGAEFTLAGWLEPASEVGGDTFDYTVERQKLHLSISDAMGHTINAAQLATLAVGSLRNSRRSKATVRESAVNANAVIDENATNEQFVSAFLMQIDLETGVASAVNAGHPTGYLMRDGVVTELALEVDLPLGMMADAEYHEQNMTLLPGDRLVLLTDGMLERNAESLDVCRALEDMGELHPREVVHHFARAVLGATGGELKDDATVLCVDWYGRQPGDGSRIASAGASQTRTSNTDIVLD